MERILVVTLSNIGDAILTTPVLEALHRRDPEARIDLVADRRSAAVFAAAPYLGDIYLKEKRAGLSGTMQLVGALRRQRYGLVVDLRTPHLPWLLRADRRLIRMAFRESPHHAVEDHMATLRPLGLDTPIPDCRIHLDAAARNYAASALATHPTVRHWLALAPGANYPGKIWPAANFAALAQRLAGWCEGLILLGGDGDRAAAKGIAAAASLPVVDVTGETTLLQAGALLEQARAFVGNDSGLGHLAAAVGTPTCTVFGIGRPARYHPWGRRAIWLVGPGEDLIQVLPAMVAEALVHHVAELEKQPVDASCA